MGPSSNSSGSGHLLAEAGHDPTLTSTPNHSNLETSQNNNPAAPGLDMTSNDLMTSSVTSIGEDGLANRSTPKRPARKSSTHRSKSIRNL